MSSAGFICSGGPLNENGRKRKDRQILRSCRRAGKTVNHEGDGDNNSWRD